jgi:hypothetical protein
MLAVLRKWQGCSKLDGILRTERNRFHGYLHPVQMASLPIRDYFVACPLVPAVSAQLPRPGGDPFGVTETWTEGTRIGEAAASVIKDLFEAQGRAVERIDTKVFLLWSTLHGLIALTMTGRLAGMPDDLTPLVEQVIHDTLRAWQIPEEPEGTVRG